MPPSAVWYANFRPPNRPLAGRIRLLSQTPHLLHLTKKRHPHLLHLTKKTDPPALLLTKKTAIRPGRFTASQIEGKPE